MEADHNLCAADTKSELPKSEANQKDTDGSAKIGSWVETPCLISEVRLAILRWRAS